MADSSPAFFDIPVLQAATLSSHFIYQYGDLPFFAPEVRKVQRSVFLKFLVSHEPDVYRWSRIVEVMEGQPYRWQQKNVKIYFRVEGVEQILRCDCVSAKPLESDEVHQYVASCAPDEPRLPTAEEVVSLKEHFSSRVAHRTIGDLDKELIEDYAASLGNPVGNVAQKHTVTVLENLKLQSDLGLISSFHLTGCSSRAQQRSSGRMSDSFPSQRLSQSFARMSQSLSQPPGSPGDAPVDLGSAQRWDEARKNEESFARYASHPERVEFIGKLASMTKDNAMHNSVAILKASQSQRLRQSNMVESTGLWITDDAAREKTAQRHLDAEEAKKKGDGKKDQQATKPKPSDASKSSGGGGAGDMLGGGAVDGVLSQRASQELLESISVSFLDEITALAEAAPQPRATPLAAAAAAVASSNKRARDE